MKQPEDLAGLLKLCLPPKVRSHNVLYISRLSKDGTLFAFNLLGNVSTYITINLRGYIFTSLWTRRKQNRLGRIREQEIVYLKIIIYFSTVYTWNIALKETNPLLIFWELYPSRFPALPSHCHQNRGAEASAR